MNINAEAEGLAARMTTDDGGLVAQMLGAQTNDFNFTVESLHRVDDLLARMHRRNRAHQKFLGLIPLPASGQIHPKLGDTDAFAAFAVRVGAYVGEVIRRNGRPDYDWFTHGIWIETHADHERILGPSPTLGTALILGHGEDCCFPIGKVLKFVANGAGDSTYFFARMITRGLKQEAAT